MFTVDVSLNVLIFELINVPDVKKTPNNSVGSTFNFTLLDLQKATVHEKNF